MLDELLGRAELKRRIETLEEDKRHLQRQLDAESERRADAVSARQDAEERINRLEDRIEALGDRVARSESADDDGRAFRGVDSLRGDRLIDVLDRLDSVEAGPEGALTAAVTDDDRPLPETVADAAGDDAPLVRRAAPTVYCTDDAGLVSIGLRPPLVPAAFARWGDGFELDRAWFRPTGRLLFGVVRADVCAVGEYVDGKRRDWAGFESDVKADHSKGGFSQGRFERIREEQIAEHLEKATDLLERRREAFDPDRVVLTGERAVLAELGALADHTARTDAGGDPGAALEHAFADFWTTRLVRI